MSAVLNAYAVIATLVGEPAGRSVAPHLREASMCAANLGEAMDVCVRVHGNTEGAVLEKIEWLIAGGREVVPLDLTLALAAGALRARRYRKRECQISMGDSMAAAPRGSPSAASGHVGSRSRAGFLGRGNRGAPAAGQSRPAAARV